MDACAFSCCDRFTSKMRVLACLSIFKIALIVAGLALSAEHAAACSCMRAANAEQQAAGADLIFVGTPTASETTSPEKPKRSFWQRVQFWKPAPPAPVLRFQSREMSTSFSVEIVLKGPESTAITIHTTAPDGANCGMSFRQATSHLVLAYQSKDGVYRTNACTAPQFSRAEFEAHWPTSQGCLPPAFPRGGSSQPNTSSTPTSNTRAMRNALSSEGE